MMWHRQSTSGMKLVDHRRRHVKTVKAVLMIGLVPGTQMMTRSASSLLLPEIQRHFAVSDTQIGHLQGTFDLFLASFLALPCAFFVDRYGSRCVLKNLILIWVISHLSCGLSASFSQFCFFKIIIAATEIGMVPVIYAMTPQYAGAINLMLTNAAVGALITLSYGAGYYFSGALFTVATLFAPARSDGLWRGVEAVSALLGLLLLLAVIVLPRPGIVSTGVRLTRRFIPGCTMRRDLKRRFLTLALLAGPNAFAAQGTLSMMTLALHRRFELDLSSLGHHLGAMSWLIGFLGFPVAAAVDSVARHVFRADIRLEIMLICLTMALPFIGAASIVSNAHLDIAMVGAFLFFSGVANVPIPTVIQEVTPTSLHGRVFAIWSLFMSAFGALGAVTMGVISDRFLSGKLLLSISILATSALALVVGPMALYLLFGKTRVTASLTSYEQ
ncbi:MFS transporter [Candidatus Kirkpatrickella diaphorinae]|uniref:MFS transporter n=1 Tax=Candidatus Kirkpatrickella diaphorinae TaxID=2984322 RepID=A0ABY6GJ57_9PROT|nr:MFS transporter [Candidatus Kirkpatrickella diaphorinae]UYH50888.1 MFS transporter [Candidatus Kirkpatrickella diaphorinae]